MRKVKTDEEKAAKFLASVANDITLDLDQIGYYLARNSRNVSFRRLSEIIDAAEEEKESEHGGIRNIISE